MIQQLFINVLKEHERRLFTKRVEREQQERKLKRELYLKKELEARKLKHEEHEELINELVKILFNF